MGSRIQIPKRAVEEFEGVSCDGYVRTLCLWKGRIVGSRIRDPEGMLVTEWSIRSGKRHGTFREWDERGRLEFETYYVNDLEHGYAKQWMRGKLVGGYRMVMGTGLDLWRDDRGRISEEFPRVDGRPHGTERWWNEDQRTVSEEMHYYRGRQHGITRRWTSRGRLERGYPQFYIRDKKVTKAEYLKRSARSRTLPAYRPEDDRPDRSLPKGVCR